MAKVETIQTSFASGELAPALFGRTDIAQYANAAATIENFLIRPYGSVISTPGTEFVNECKTGGSTGVVRLLSFVFSRTDSYVIEMGVGYFRFYTDGAVVVSPGTTPYEVAHTYTADELFQIQFVQLNDIIFITHKDHKPAKLTRSSATSWALEDFDFKGGPFLDLNTDDDVKLTASATNGTVNITVSPTNATTDGNDVFFVSSGATLGHHGTYWRIGALRTDDTTGLDVQGYVRIDHVVNSYTATATVMKILRSSTNTSQWQEGSWSDVRGWPARVNFHQQRLALARTTYQPQNIWLSKSFIFDDFAVDDGSDANGMNLQMASNESNDIQWLASAKALVAGTYGGEFVVRSAEDAALTPSNVNVQKENSWGSEPIVPKRIGNFFYYIQRFGQKVRELFYSWDLSNYKSIDNTILSPHIAGDGIIDMAYQQNPDTILWCVTTNGTLATLTREVDQEIQGWSRQITLGNYEAVATIPSQSRLSDEVWVVVNRTINGSTKRYIERFKSQIVPDRQDQCFYVHSGLTYDAYAVNTTVTIGLSATAGTSVIVTSSAAYFAAGNVGKRIRAIDSDGATVGELEITSYSSSTIVVGKVKSGFDASAYAAGLWGLSVSSITGLSHLETSSVIALADGGTDKPNKVVTSGGITLGYDYFVVNVGLPYTQKLTTLPQEAGAQRGTSQGKIQRISEVAFKVNRSHKGFSVGGKEEYLEKIRFRDPTTDMGTPELLYTGVIPNVTFRDDYQYGSQVLLENSDPLPIELLSVITTIDTNEK